MRVLRSLDPFVTLDPLQVQWMPGPLSQLVKILELCSAVTLSKGMDIIHVANNCPSLDRELIGRQLRQITPFDQSAVHVPHTGFDKARMLKF